MRTHAIFLGALALCASGCSEQEPAQPGDPTSAQNIPAAETVQEQPVFDEAFVEHMHEHADKLDELMFALADGNLEDAMTPAYWLSRHETVDGVPQGRRGASLQAMPGVSRGGGNQLPVTAAQLAANPVSACRAVSSRDGMTPDAHRARVNAQTAALIPMPEILCMALGKKLT